jgi:hypothetical protein
MLRKKASLGRALQVLEQGFVFMNCAVYEVFLKRRLPDMLSVFTVFTAPALYVIDRLGLGR